MPQKNIKLFVANLAEFDDTAFHSDENDYQQMYI